MRTTAATAVACLQATESPRRVLLSLTLVCCKDGQNTHDFAQTIDPHGQRGMGVSGIASMGIYLGRHLVWLNHG